MHLGPWTGVANSESPALQVLVRPSEAYQRVGCAGYQAYAELQVKGVREGELCMEALLLVSNISQHHIALRFLKDFMTRIAPANWKVTHSGPLQVSSVALPVAPRAFHQQLVLKKQYMPF